MTKILAPVREKGNSLQTENNFVVCRKNVLTLKKKKRRDQPPFPAPVLKYPVKMSFIIMGYILEKWDKNSNVNPPSPPPPFPTHTPLCIWTPFPEIQDPPLTLHHKAYAKTGSGVKLLSGAMELRVFFSVFFEWKWPKITLMILCRLGIILHAHNFVVCRKILSLKLHSL